MAEIFLNGQCLNGIVRKMPPKYQDQMIVNLRNASEQLESALEQASIANKAKSDFLSNNGLEGRCRNHGQAAGVLQHSQQQCNLSAPQMARNINWKK